jgi:hypothetical protein
MEMRFCRRQGLAFAGQRRPALGAEAPPPTGRRIELRYLTFGNDISGAPECREDGDGRAAVFPTALAMVHICKKDSGFSTRRPGEAAASADLEIAVVFSYRTMNES